MRHRHSTGKLPKTTGQGGLGRTTGFPPKIPGDPYLQRCPVPSAAVPGWDASRSCPAAAWGQQRGAEPSPSPHNTQVVGQLPGRAAGLQLPGAPAPPCPVPMGCSPPRPLGAVVPPPPQPLRLTRFPWERRICVAAKKANTLRALMCFSF